jgi:hypothetical protein
MGCNLLGVLIWEYPPRFPVVSPTDAVEQQDNENVVASPPRRAVHTAIAHPHRRAILIRPL